MMAKTEKVLWTNWAVDGLTHYAPWNMYGHIQLGHIESMNCWCAPDLKARCPKCRGEGCWDCGGEGQIDGSILDPRRVRQVLHRNFDNDDD